MGMGVGVVGEPLCAHFIAPMSLTQVTGENIY